MTKKLTSKDAVSGRTGLSFPIKLFFGLLLTIVLLVALISFIDTGSIVEELKRLDLQWVGIAFGLWFITMLLRAVRFRSLTREIDFLLMMGVTTIHTAMLRVMPFRTGEIIYVLLMQRVGPKNAVHDVLNLIIIRIIDLIVVIFAFVISLSFTNAPYDTDPRVLWTITAALSVVGILVLLNLQHALRLLLTSIHFIARHIGFEHQRIVQKVGSKIEEAIAIHQKFSYGELVRHIALSIAFWGTFTLMTGAFLQAFGVHLSIFELLFCTTLTTMASLIPVAGLGSFGALESGWAVSLAILGITKETAITSGLFYSVATLIWSFFLAAPFAFYIFSGNRRGPSSK